MFVDLPGWACEREAESLFRPLCFLFFYGDLVGCQGLRSPPNLHNNGANLGCLWRLICVMRDARERASASLGRDQMGVLIFFFSFFLLISQLRACSGKSSESSLFAQKRLDIGKANISTVSSLALFSFSSPFFCVSGKNCWLDHTSLYLAYRSEPRHPHLSLTVFLIHYVRSYIRKQNTEISDGRVHFRTEVHFVVGDHNLIRAFSGPQGCLESARGQQRASEAKNEDSLLYPNPRWR